jgi:AcrR family transcriptional regulator
MISNRKPKTKEKLLQAAIKVFVEKGYRGATAQEICQRAGANMAAVNYYFGGKEKLYQYILELVFQTWVSCETPGELAHRKTDTAEGKLYTYIRFFLRRSYGIGDEYDPDIATILSLEMARPSQFLDKIVQSYIVPDCNSFHKILQEILGPRATYKVLTDCGCSIVGQILY